MNWTQKQKELLEIAKKKGFITHSDLLITYTSSISRKANLDRFLMLKIFNPSPLGDSFKFNPEALEELEK